MNPTKEPTETQRALASRMQHLLTAGHPSYVESGALRLIVEHDAQLTARAEAAESLASKGKSAVNAAILYMAMDSDSEDFDEAQFHRLRDEAQEFLALTPASMVSKLAELEKEVTRLQEVIKTAARSDATLVAVVGAQGEGAKIAELTARLAEQDAELARLRGKLSDYETPALAQLAIAKYGDKLTEEQRTYLGVEVSHEMRCDHNGDCLDRPRFNSRAVILLLVALYDCEQERDALRARVSELEKQNGYATDELVNCAKRAEKAEQRAERLAQTLRFIKEECDWEPPRGEFGGGGDDRIGPAIAAALADQPAQRTIGSLTEAESENAVQAFCLSQPAQANTREAALIAEVQRLKEWEAIAKRVDAKMLAEQADHNKTVDRLVACKAQRDALIAAGDAMQGAAEMLGLANSVDREERKAKFVAARDAYLAAKQGAQPVEKCECGNAPAVTSDNEGVPLCAGCTKMLDDEARDEELAALREDRAIGDHCRAFVAKQQISSPETVHQSDRVIVNAYEFIEGVCDLVGYWRDPEDEDAARKQEGAS